MRDLLQDTLSLIAVSGLVLVIGAYLGAMT